MVRKHFIFYGRVQSVGFRYTARYLALDLGLTGWVQNNWDGSVEMEVQGKGMQVAALLSRLKTARYIRIDRIEAKDIPVIKETAFSVRY